MYYDFLINVIVVLFLCGIIIWIDLSLNRKYSHYILGVMFGLITIFVIHGRIPVAKGSYCDFRLITMTMAGFIGGPITAAIAAIISVLYRYKVGGSGLMGGITSIIVFACFGSILGRYLRKSQSRKQVSSWLRQVLSWFSIGIVMVLIFLIILSFTSPSNFRIIAVPYLIITPLATTIIFNYYFWSYNYFCNITEMKRMQAEKIEQLTKHLKLEADLSRSNQLIADIINNMQDGFYVLDKQCRFAYINHAGQIAFGKSLNEILGNKITDVIRVNDTALLHYHKVMSEKKSVTFEIISEALGNKWFEINAYPTEIGMTCYFRDISSRKIAEETLRQSEEKFSKAFHGGPIMMTLATVAEGKFIDANEALCSGLGYTREEIIGHTSKELNIFVDMDKRQDRGKMLMEQGRIENVELDFRTKSGEIRHGLSWSQLFYLDGFPCHITGLIDVTEQIHIQKEMAKLDRLNLVGQMAAGIGHEIRNPMTTVRGYLQLLGVKPDYVAQKPTFDLMISELDRANAIITEFLSLAQTKQAELKSQNLNDVLSHLYPLLEADSFTQNKQICFIPGEIPNIELNVKEISQLILNLTRNGLQAMEERGCLTVKSYLQDSKVVLAIADEGCGIPPENISKIGTPFFTTKDNGTGLGLAICYRIVESHNAKILIDSTPRGTTFFVLFPIPDEDKDDKDKDKNEMIA